MSAGGELERRELEGDVVDGPGRDQLDDDGEEVGADLADMGKMLTVASYAGMDHGRRLIAANEALRRLHTPPDPAKDVRCPTCRTSSGKLAPWPCVTLVEVLEAMGMPIKIDIEALRDWGRVRNGGKPKTARGRRMLGLPER